MFENANRAKRRLLNDGPGAVIEQLSRLVLHRKVSPYFEARIERSTLTEDELKTWCDQNGYFFEYYDTDSTHELALPQVPGDRSEHLEADIRRTYEPQVTTDPPFVSVIPDVDVLAPDAIPVCRNGYLQELSLTPRKIVVGLGFALATGTAPSGSMSIRSSCQAESILSLAGPFDDNYFHWFRDYLPRLEGLEYYRTKTGEDVRVVIPADPPNWIEQSLRALGYDDGKWIEWPGRNVHAKRYLLSKPRVEHRPNGGDRPQIVSPHSYRWIADRIVDYFDASRSGGSERIYISRDDATARRITNEREVMRVLSERGFERYLLSELDFSDQVRLFSNAEVVVGPHGAGLINMIFSTNASVIELLGPKTSYDDPGLFYTIAATIGHEYGCVEGTVVNRDVRVDVAELSQLLDKMVDR